MYNRNKTEYKTEQFRVTMVLFSLNAYEVQKIKRYLYGLQNQENFKKELKLETNLSRQMGLGQAEKNAQCFPEKESMLSRERALMSEEHTLLLATYNVSCGLGD